MTIDELNKLYELLEKWQAVQSSMTGIINVVRVKQEVDQFRHSKEVQKDV